MNNIKPIKSRKNMMVQRKRNEKYQSYDINQAKFLGQSLMIEPAEQINEASEESASDQEQPTIASNFDVHVTESGFSNRKSKISRVNKPIFG